VTAPPLLTIPNVSVGRDLAVVSAVGDAFCSAGLRLLDVHSDDDHGRSVFTLSGEPAQIAQGLVRGACAAADRVDLTEHRGQHPHVGVLDVAPVVYLNDDQRGQAFATALVAADLLGEAGFPTYLYGLLTSGRTRAELRRGGIEALQAIKPDFGPAAIDPRRGAALVAARPPLLAFNFFIDGEPEDAKRIAGLIRESGPEGLASVRALGMEVDGRAQVTTNVEDHRAMPLAHVLGAIERHARVEEAELVGLAPASAFAGWPDRVPVRNRRTLEEAGVL
jgi:glutamate formiminotransferase